MDELDMDNAFKKISQNLMRSDISKKKRKCKKCGRAVTLVGNTIVCPYCLTEGGLF